jgi:hypothetical protein
MLQINSLFNSLEDAMLSQVELIGTVPLFHLYCARVTILVHRDKCVRETEVW